VNRICDYIYVIDFGKPMLDSGHGQRIDIGLAEVDHVDVVTDPIHECHVVFDQQDADPALGDDASENLANRSSRPDET